MRCCLLHSHIALLAQPKYGVFLLLCYSVNTFEKVFEWCNKTHPPPKPSFVLRLLFDGAALQPSDTPAMHDMEEEDYIDVAYRPTAVNSIPVASVPPVSFDLSADSEPKASPHAPTTARVTNGMVDVRQAREGAGRGSDAYRHSQPPHQCSSGSNSQGLSSDTVCIPSRFRFLLCL